jgi:hypothetical protein
VYELFWQTYPQIQHPSLELEEKRKEAAKRLSILMDKASEEAQANGLTPEILQEILADE